MKKKKWVIISCIAFIILIITISLLIVNSLLVNNKTFYKTTYIGIDNQEFFIPKYSYFKKECCMTAATFYSLRSKKDLEKEINDYMKDFEYFEDEHTYGYMKGDLFIQNYEVTDHRLYREIIITY